MEASFYIGDSNGDLMNVTGKMWDDILKAISKGQNEGASGVYRRMEAYPELSL